MGKGVRTPLPRAGLRSCLSTPLYVHLTATLLPAILPLCIRLCKEQRIMDRFAYRQVAADLWLVYRTRNDQPMAYCHSEAHARDMVGIYERSSR